MIITSSKRVGLHAHIYHCPDIYAPRYLCAQIFMHLDIGILGHSNLVRTDRQDNGNYAVLLGVPQPFAGEKIISAPCSGWRGTFKLSTNEMPAIAAPDRNTAAGDTSHNIPKLTGTMTAAI